MAAPLTPNMIDAQQRLQNAMLLRQQGAGPSGSLGQGIGNAMSSLAGALMQRNAMNDIKAIQQGQIDTQANAMRNVLGVGGSPSPTPSAPSSLSGGPPTANAAPAPPVLPSQGMGGAPTPSSPNGLVWAERGPGALLRMIPGSALRPGEQSFGVTPGTIGAGSWPSPTPAAPGYGMAPPPSAGVQPTTVPYPTPGYGGGMPGAATAQSGPAMAAEGMAVGAPPPPPPAPNLFDPNPIAQQGGIQPNAGGYYTPGAVPISMEDRDLLIRTIYGEAANEPPEGKAQVAQVILNRAALGDYGGGGVRDVVLAKHQFEPWNNETARARMQSLSPSDPRYEEIGRIVDAVVNGEATLPAPDATHFYAPEAQAALGRDVPSWAQGQPGQPIGAHTFFDLGNGGAGSQPRPLPPEMMAPQEGPGAQYGFDEMAFGAQQPGATLRTPMNAPGNIDLNARPVVQNGSNYSTVRSISINEDGREILIPTVSDDGRLLSDQEAIDLYHRTGRHLGVFNSPQEATRYAQQLHKNQEQQYAPPAQMPPVQSSGNPYDRVPMEVKQQIVALYEAGMPEQANALLQQAMQSLPDAQWSEPFQMPDGALAQRDTITGRVDILVPAQEARKGQLAEIGTPEGQKQRAFVFEDGRIVPLGAPYADKSGVNVNVGQGMTKPLEKMVNDWVEAGASAQKLDQGAALFSALAQAAPETGMWASVAQQYGPYLNAMGINVEGLDKLQAMQAVALNLAMNMKPIGSGAVSNYEQLLFQQQAPQLANTPEGNQIIVATLRAMAQYDIERGKVAQAIATQEMTPQEGIRLINSFPSPMAAFRRYAEERGLLPPAQGGAPRPGLDLSGPRPPADINAPRAVNPQTGETLILQNGQWVPL